MELSQWRDAIVTNGLAIGLPGAKQRHFYAPDVHIWMSGQRWPMAGHHQGIEDFDALVETDAMLWPGGTAYAGNEYWWNGDSAVVHWFARNRTWDGECCANSGMTVIHIDNGLITEARVYTDTEFLAESLRGWESRLSPAVIERLGAKPDWGFPRYPDPFENHGWAFDTATRDGRDSYPANMSPFRQRWLLANGVETGGTGTTGNIDMESLDTDLSKLFDNGIAEIIFQGRTIPLGGRYSAGQGDVPTWFRMLRKIWPKPSKMVKVLFWFNESGVAYEWFSHNLTFRGERTRNSGLTHIKVRGNEIFQYIEHTDSDYFAEVHNGWRDSFGTIVEKLPNGEPPGETIYPEPWLHY